MTISSSHDIEPLQSGSILWGGSQLLLSMSERQDGEMCRWRRRDLMKRMNLRRTHSQRRMTWTSSWWCFPQCIWARGSLYYMYDEKYGGASLYCIDYDIMIWMHVDAYFCIFMNLMSILLWWWLCLYDVYDICMHDYMMTHDINYFLYAMINVPL